MSSYGVHKRKAVGSATEAEWDIKNFRVRPKFRKDHEQVNQDIEDAYEKYRKRFRDLKDSPSFRPEDVFLEVAVAKSSLYDLAAYMEDVRLNKSGHSYLNLSAKLAKIK